MCAAPATARAELDALLALRREQSETRLQELLDYCETSQCRHAMIARHFGQSLEPCGDACDSCLGTKRGVAKGRAVAPTADQVADVGRVLLEALQSLPFPLGRTGLAKVVAGAADIAVAQDRCPQFGMLAGFSLHALRAFLDTLIAEGLCALQQQGDYPLLALTEAGLDALQDSTEILPNPNRTARAIRPSSSAPAYDDEPAAGMPMTADEDDRFEQLRAWRRIEAERAKVPPYVIFHDATLRAIAATNPTTLEELGRLSGIGPRKIESYGEAVLALLRGEDTP
jgi:ATP-dependent DNA helicase RecQ